MGRIALTSSAGKVAALALSLLTKNVSAAPEPLVPKDTVYTSQAAASIEPPQMETAQSVDKNLSVSIACAQTGFRASDLMALLEPEVGETEDIFYHIAISCPPTKSAASTSRLPNESSPADSPHLFTIDVSQLMRTTTVSLDLQKLSAGDQVRAISLAVAETISLFASPPELHRPTLPPLDVPPQDSASSEILQKEESQQHPNPHSASRASTPTDPSNESKPQGNQHRELSLAIGPAFRGHWGGSTQAGATIDLHHNHWKFGAKVLAGSSVSENPGSSYNGVIGYDFLYRKFNRIRPIFGSEFSLGFVSLEKSNSPSVTASAFLGAELHLGRSWRTRTNLEAGYALLLADNANNSFLGAFVGANVLICTLL